ncbi:pyridoxal-phosphate dependent enzyme [Thomasclavelia cocleata]|uniref:1-aminocyclopropane-1-carboxylate deaminase/D-cysteine desulfhydrase n=1 Tax=Thomasclavelia cocleata TaxID=69824 RepID=UPI00351195E5
MIKTVIHKLNDNYDNDIYVKREDLLPFSFGGNKVRIAEEFFLDMERKNKNILIAYGNSRSNLCRILSNMAFQKRIPCIVISPADDDGRIVNTNNGILVNACDTQYVYCKKNTVAETVEKVLFDVRGKGLNPYYIYGDKYGKGNENIPVNAYYKVYSQILKQEAELNSRFDYIFLATGTGMTQAGLLCGKLLNPDDNHKIIGISVARTSENEREVLKNYIKSFLIKINKNVAENEILDVIKIDDNYIQDGYGKANDQIMTKISDIYKSEGFYLDPTYTGKAFFGMLEYLNSNNIIRKRILFIHTGGLPLFFDNIKYLFRE